LSSTALFINEFGSSLNAVRSSESVERVKLGETWSYVTVWTVVFQLLTAFVLPNTHIVA